MERPDRAATARERCSSVENTGEELEDFEALVRLYRPRIFRFLLASLRDRETAENLTQDCFVRAYQSRAQFRGGASVATWLMQIAANLLRDHESSGRLRFWRRMLRREADVADLGASVPDRQQSPEALAVIEEQVRGIWRRRGPAAAAAHRVPAAVRGRHGPSGNRRRHRHEGRHG
jgi:RNA polymerase sigma-70 factor (ECF subfamily)